MYESLKKCIEDGGVFEISPSEFNLNTVSTYQTRLTRDLGRKVKLTYNGKCIYDLLSGLDVDALNKASNKVKSGFDLSVEDRGEIFKCLMDIKDMAYSLGFDISIDTLDEEDM